jgi:hypothetical protein
MIKKPGISERIIFLLGSYKYGFQNIRKTKPVSSFCIAAAESHPFPRLAVLKKPRWWVFPSAADKRPGWLTGFIDREEQYARTEGVSKSFSSCKEREGAGRKGMIAREVLFGVEDMEAKILFELGVLNGSSEIMETREQAQAQ